MSATCSELSNILCFSTVHCLSHCVATKCSFFHLIAAAITVAVLYVCTVCLCHFLGVSICCVCMVDDVCVLLLWLYQYNFILSAALHRDRCTMCRDSNANRKNGWFLLKRATSKGCGDVWRAVGCHKQCPWHIRVGHASLRPLLFAGLRKSHALSAVRRQ